VGVTAHTSAYPAALAISARALRAGSRTVLGGPHPSALPEEALASGVVDDVVVGDGERALADIARGARRGVHQGGPAHDRVPAYELLDMSRYGRGTITSRRRPSYAVFSMRGCPFACTFCQRRSRHVLIGLDVVFASIDRLVDEHGMRDFKLMDGTFAFDDERTRAFCERLAGYGLTWSCQARADLLTDELVSRMAEAGCTSVGIGVESASAEERRALGKAVDMERTRRVVRACQDRGVAVRACFVLGFPDDTEASVRATVRAAVELDPDYGNFSILTPFPGTPLWDELARRSIAVSRDWARFNTFELVFDHPRFTPRRLEGMLRDAYRTFYLSGSFARRRLGALVRDPRDALNTARGVAAFARLVGG
jgi:radical SAM superfamily enzyme YgiQ (UPF0313 family)